MTRKNKRYTFAALITTLVILLLGYTNCSKTEFSPLNSVITGNPITPTEGSSRILAAVCTVISNCQNQVSFTKCTSGVASTSGIGPAIGLNSQAYSGPFSVIQNAEALGAISSKPVGTNNCLAAINGLSCSDPKVLAAYNASQANPFSQVPGMIPTSANTCPLAMSPTGLAANLMGLWHLDEPGGSTNFLDFSGNNLTATCSGAACPTAGVPGVSSNFNLAATFLSQHIDAVNPSALNFGTGDFSVSAWFKTTYNVPSGPGQYPTIVSHIGQLAPSFTVAQGWALEFNKDNDPAGSNKIGFNVVINGSQVGAPYSNGPVNDGAWHNVVGVRVGASISLYLDGVIQSTYVLPTGTGSVDPDISYPLRIGASSFSANQFPFQGSIDEVTIWQRALSAQDILNYYNQAPL